MNYQSVSAKNQANKTAGPKEANTSAGIKDDIDIGNSEREAEPAHTVNTASIPVHTASPLRVFSAGEPSFSYLDLYANQDDSWIPELVDTLDNLSDGIFTIASYDDEGAMVDFTNLESTMNIESQKGHRQEEGIDYDEVFAPVARIEAIRIFLDFSSFMGFIVYQMDVKSAFLYGIIDEEVYVSQPPGFVDPHFPKQVYKVVKALYDLYQAPRAWYATLSTFLLHNGYRKGIIDKTLFIKKDKNDIMLVKQKEDGIFISHDKYVAKILKKFDFASVKTASTLIETQEPLVKDEEAVDVDVQLYRSMIGSLMYLTTSRNDIMFAACNCSRFQVTPKTSHLHAVKRIFSDYAGANLDRKSITGEAEYVAAANCCGQVLWIQNQMLDYRFNFMNTKIYIDNESTICMVKNPVFHSKTKHIEIRHHFIRDAYEKKLIQVLKIHTDDNVAELLTKAFNVSMFHFLVVNIRMMNL
ncbi:putative ribonuclease H-like domain-containing protein [Tanacetum coccineum]